MVWFDVMAGTLRASERLPWAGACIAFASVVHAAVLLVYSAVFLGLANTELSWQGVEQVPRWFQALFAAGILGSHGVVAFGPMFSERWARSGFVRTGRAVVAVICAVSVVFAVLMAPFAAVSGAEWEGWVLLLSLGVSGVIVLASLKRRPGL